MKKDLCLFGRKYSGWRLVKRKTTRTQWIQVQLLVCNSKDWKCRISHCCVVFGPKKWKRNIQIRQHCVFINTTAFFLIPKIMHRIIGIIEIDTPDLKQWTEPNVSTVSSVSYECIHCRQNSFKKVVLWNEQFLHAARLDIRLVVTHRSFSPPNLWYTVYSYLASSIMGWIWGWQTVPKSVWQFMGQFGAFKARSTKCLSSYVLLRHL